MHKVSRPFIINGAASGCTSEVHHRRNVCPPPKKIWISASLRLLESQTHGRLVSLTLLQFFLFFFFLYAPIFLTYQLEDEPPAGCVFVKHFMTHGLFYNRINCTTIRVLVCFFFFFLSPGLWTAPSCVQSHWFSPQIRICALIQT